MTKDAEQIDTGGGSSQGGYEPSDLSPKAIGLFGAALGLMIGAVLIVAYAMLDVFAVGRPHEETRLAPVAAEQQPPEPRLQVHPAEDLAKLRADEQEQLESYGWVDPAAGVVSIPIERAMDLLAEKESAAGIGRANRRSGAK